MKALLDMMPDGAIALNWKHHKSSIKERHDTMNNLLLFFSLAVDLSDFQRPHAIALTVSSLIGEGSGAGGGGGGGEKG